MATFNDHLGPLVMSLSLVGGLTSTGCGKIGVNLDTDGGSDTDGGIHDSGGSTCGPTTHGSTTGNGTGGTSSETGETGTSSSTGSETDTETSSTSGTTSGSSSTETSDVGSSETSTDASGTGNDGGEVDPELDYRIRIENPGSERQVNASLGFAHPFLKGDFPTGTQLEAVVVDSGQVLPIQTDIKATHADGSLRHALLSTIVPELAAGESLELELRGRGSQARGAAVELAQLIAVAPDVRVDLHLGDSHYSVELSDLLATPQSQWRKGALVSEWVFTSELIDQASAVAHPHLRARFYVAKYQGLDNVRVDVVIENNFTHVPDPGNFTYDVEISVDGHPRFSFAGLTHYHHSRWRERIWLGDAPALHLAHDPATLMATMALPNYDPQLIGAVDDSAYADIDYDEEVRSDGFATGAFSPLGRGFAVAYMPTTGGRRDIGPQPAWFASYLLNQNPRMRRAMLEMADTAGSWSIHYRDHETGALLSLQDYPDLSSHFNSRNKPAVCAEACPSPLSADGAHQPSMAYLPYLVTGDYFLLEELQFWANYNALKVPAGDGYREGAKGLFYGQLREIAWSLRTLGHAAYITPDDNINKDYFESMLAYNIENLSDDYINPEVNSYGALKPYGDSALSGWQDDFFTWAVVRLVLLGYEEARPIADWKSRFSVQRMGFGPEDDRWCWTFAAPYQFRNMFTGSGFPSDMNALWFDNYGQYDHLECASAEFQTMAGLRAGEMAGRAQEPAGYPAIMTAALSSAVDMGVEDADLAWSRFDGRLLRPDYAGYPNWALVPRDSQVP